MMYRFVRLLLTAAVLIGVAATASARDDEVNVYSHRHYDIDLELYRQFENETGIKVNLIEGKADELIARLEREGDASPADILMTVDAGRLHRAKAAGLLQPVSSEVLAAQVLEHLRDPEGYWFALTKRAWWSTIPIAWIPAN